MSTPRPYRMTTRADQTEATRQRIMAAVVTLAQERLTIEITLDDVARAAKTTVQTILRHYGSRDALLDAVIEATAAQVESEREAPPGDVVAALRTLVDHYELRGDFMVRMVGQESTDARIRSFTEPGKALHRAWVTTVFAPWCVAAADTDALIDLLVVATDLHTWKLLRRDRRLDRPTTEARMHRLVDAVLAQAQKEQL